MDVYGFILLFILWISPYWWVGKLRKGINDKLLILGIIAVFISFCGGILLLGCMVSLLSMHFFIAYYCKYGCNGIIMAFLPKSLISSFRQDMPDNSTSQIKDDDYVGNFITCEQEEALKNFWENAESVKLEKDKIDTIYDHEGNIDYDAVEKANKEMEAQKYCAEK